ncbi:MAG: DUF839 domain-containing protein [Methylomonas sp.]|nr:DUF839 domain-containing protein [Methylomonas sp.]
MNKTLLAAVIGMVCANAYAIDPFTPLTASATSGNTNENTKPFKLPAGWMQTELTDVNAMNALFGGSYPSTFRAWDMLDIGGANHEFIYIPHEVQQGAGVTRYNRDNGTAAILLQGNNTGIFQSNPASWSAASDDFGALDPAVLTPWNTLLTGEEWAGNGRLFEMLNPEAATGVADANWRWLSSIPSVSHEGLKFDAAGNLYFIDEDNSGSIYKFVPKVAGDLSVGQTFVLKVTAYAGNPSATWNNAANAGQPRTGEATWVAITDTDGNKTTNADPFSFTNRGGRAAADEVAGAPYGRPEDLHFGKLGNDHEVLYVATTSEAAVYSIELNPNGDSDNSDAYVRLFAKGGVTPNSNGAIVPAGNQSTYGLGSPDNLYVDADGKVYIIEDQNPGDIWMATDADKDGVAEKMDMFASLGPFGSEPTGFMADPRGGFLTMVQHPSSNNDALWSIQADTDGDNLADSQDNCSAVANANQRDTNNDGYGNICDADLNNDGIVNQADAGIFRGAFGSTNADADFNGDGIVNQVDNGIFRSLFGAEPGPSGTAQ